MGDNEEYELRGSVTTGVNSLLAWWGKAIIPRERLYDWQINPVRDPVCKPTSIPEEARNYLLMDHPKLIELKQRYVKCDPQVTTPLQWTDAYVGARDLAYFRGDNAYLWQVRSGAYTTNGNYNVVGHLVATYYVKSVDRHNLLDQLTEDDAFGNFIFEVADRIISRDLLDSIIEIDFLDRHLSLMSRTHFTMLDIGAGYGRLAHRISTAVAGLRQYICTDAIAYSTFISEFYLRYRNVVEKTRVVALDEVDASLANEDIDIAVNICSFPECRVDAIEWWISRLARWRIKYLVISCISDRLQTNDRKELLPILKRHRYRLAVLEPKYRDNLVQKYGIAPCYYSLFELQ